ncbi:MAG: septum formation inhibitor Maf, partial [Desulfobacterales bacterium]
ILASKSPRRRDLLEQAGLEFSVVASEFDENSVIPSSPETYVKYLAESKAQDISRKYPDSWVIGADTIVFINDNILGKPTSSDEARRMLKILNDTTHQVVTGYCICHQNKPCSFSETVKTDVRFKKLTQKEIEWYINSGEPFDKAGGYAIQGLGMFLVKRINGSYTNVVGLPVCEVLDYLIKHEVVELTGGR